jgi:hypothetical protein
MSVHLYDLILAQALVGLGADNSTDLCVCPPRLNHSHRSTSPRVEFQNSPSNRPRLGLPSQKHAMRLLLLEDLPRKSHSPRCTHRR